VRRRLITTRLPTPAPTTDTGYEGYPYDPIYDSLGFGFGGFDHFRHDRDFGQGRGDHDFAQHAGHGFARFGGRRFAAHGSFSGHHG
jgi:hypothetical protein